GRERIVAGDHHRADANHAQPVEPLAHAAFDDVLEIDRPDDPAVLGHNERRPALASDARDVLLHLLGEIAAALTDELAHRISRTFADRAAVLEVQSGHPR